MLDNLASQVVAGGVIAFAGGTNVFRAGLEGALLSKAIMHETGAPYSHIGLVPPARFWPGATRPTLIESTIWLKVSGPQLNDLKIRLETDYVARGGQATYFEFLPQFDPDWNKIDAAAKVLYAQVAAGKLHYSVLRLFGDAINRDWLFSALPLAGVIEHLSTDDAGVVCSECAGLLMQDGGVPALIEAAGGEWLPDVKPAGQPINCSPADLVRMQIYKPGVQLIQTQAAAA